ncbi:MAG: LPS export ABC transporter ATP-binding protein [Bdellovibrionales bacterium]|nr:LPS export ABC transporter ATP-binding protein [Bdellovibrionales bacterium]
MILKADSLSKSYKGRKVVSGVSVEVQSGRAIGLLGPNGAGKTTTFYMIVGLVPPDGGRVLLDGEDLARRPIYVRARMGLSYLPQEPSVFRKLTVEENLRIILDNLNISRTEKRERADRLLGELGIRHLAHQKAQTLSGGERRRLEIARALVLNPRFLLLDEPYAGIDPVAVNEIQKIIADLRKREIGILITDHNVRETLSSCDEAYLIRDGEVWIHGKPQEIVENEAARQFYLGEGFRL